jgi:hypothetical protein
MCAMSYLLRVSLPDRPGSLGAVATAIGRAGGDIVSLDVVERRGDRAVDDLLVELPPGSLADALVSAAQSVPDVEVESVRRYVGAGDLHLDLELVEALTADPDEAVETLADGVAGVFRAGWAVVVARRGGDAAVRYATVAAPGVVASDLPWPPLERACRIDGDEPWVPQLWRDLGIELAAAPVGSPDVVLLVGRPGGPSFLDSEVARLGHLAGLAATVAMRPAPAPLSAPPRAAARH